ncbi:Uncharacterised protein [Mycobacteroides abscessus subsp. abscessus]|nr:Uncharacterised protein [Mycobacteroides abscessus subsp. abscessus]
MSTTSASCAGTAARADSLVERTSAESLIVNAARGAATARVVTIGRTNERFGLRCGTSISHQVER